jgi:glycosyltransferase involved in cell wall biosynthesis
MTLIQLAAAQLYLTMPFVLSWSMLESMACGAAMVCSRTQPVAEVITDGENGLLADFFSPEEVAAKLNQLLESADGNAALRSAARNTIVSRYALIDILPLQMQLVRDIAAGHLPPPTAANIAAFNPAAPHQHAMWRA